MFYSDTDAFVVCGVEVLTEGFEILADFAFGLYLEFGGVVELFSARLNGDALEDVNGQEKADVVFGFGGIIKHQDHRADGVVADYALHRQLDLLARLELTDLLYLDLYFILIGVHDFEFELSDVQIA